MDTYIQGTCMEMCPLEEVKMRESERLLHPLEVVPGSEKHAKPKADKKRMVKCFSRSAAGKLTQDPKNLRPPNVLLETIQYLLKQVVSRPDVPWTIKYDFLMDRLRSVRQDMIIQNVSRAHYISILQPIVRFHAYASYRLCEEKISNYDPHINNTHLQECLKRLLSTYDDIDQINTDSGDNKMLNKFSEEHRPYFEALYILLNLGNSTALVRALNLQPSWRTELVDLALEISLAYTKSNYVRVCKFLNYLPALLAAVTFLHMADLRRNALKIMSTAYNSMNLTFPVNVLKKLLLYDTELEVIGDCKYYGLEIAEDRVRFVKEKFARDKLPVSSDVVLLAILNYHPDECLAARTFEQVYGFKFPQPLPGQNSSRPEQSLTVSPMVGQPSEGITSQIKWLKMSQSGILNTLKCVREPIVDYQEARGVSRNESISFIALITSLCTHAYTAAITILVMLWNLAPLLDGFVYFARFVLDKLIEIFETPDQKDKAIKLLFFAGEVIVILFVIFLIIGLIFMPVWVLTARIVSKIWGMIVW